MALNINWLKKEKKNGIEEHPLTAEEVREKEREYNERLNQYYDIQKRQYLEEMNRQSAVQAIISSNTGTLLGASITGANPEATVVRNPPIPTPRVRIKPAIEEDIKLIKEDQALILEALGVIMEDIKAIRNQMLDEQLKKLHELHKTSS